MRLEWPMMSSGGDTEDRDHEEETRNRHPETGAISGLWGRVTIG
jgi:hypothetical protein